MTPCFPLKTMRRSLCDVYFPRLLCRLQSNIVLAEDQVHGRHVCANMQSSLWTKGVEVQNISSKFSPEESGW